MLESLGHSDKLIGVKQCHRALKDGKVQHAFFAQDAEERLTGPLVRLCQEKDIPMTSVQSMQALGQACGIDVGAAVAVILR